jgi:peptidoglycan hydrolase CwlO-like protein
MSDLTELLRIDAEWIALHGGDRVSIAKSMNQAADKIEELEAAYKEADEQFHRLADQRDKLHSDYTALVDGLLGKIDLFENRRNTATNADSKSLWHIVSHELSALLGDEV